MGRPKKRAGASSCNCGDGMDPRVQSLMFMMTKKKKLQRIGQVVKMDQERTVNKYLRVNWREEE